MGAGATARPQEEEPLSALSSRVEQGHRLGPEYEVSLISPVLQGLQVKERYLLRIGYEALVVLHPVTKDALSYFKYQDIVCWGSGSNLFQFKVFGTVFGRKSTRDVNDVVPILFQTKHGREIEAITLDSVKMLMHDMEAEAVPKQEFVLLKTTLAKLPSDTSGVSLSWFDTVQQFGALRRFTCHQGQELMKLAKQDPSIDGFQLMEIAMFFWNTILNRDSFQLILNVFDDMSTRENLIERIRLESPKDPSAQLLKLDCPDAGGGLSSPATPPAEA